MALQEEEEESKELENAVEDVEPDDVDEEEDEEDEEFDEEDEVVTRSAKITPAPQKLSDSHPQPPAPQPPGVDTQVQVRQ